MRKSKPYEISKKVVFEAYKRVKKNKGDGIAFEEF